MKNRTLKNINEAWKIMIDSEEENPHPARISKLMNAFNGMLDALDAEDFFGTEGQHDPRNSVRIPKPQPMTSPAPPPRK